MPTLASLPLALSTAPTDLLLVEQPGGTSAVSRDTLLTGLQPAILEPTGTLLGRISLGPGGPEAIGIGAGLQLASGTLSATGTVAGGGTLAAPGGGNTVTTLADTDYVAASQAGADVWITLGALLDGETVAGLAAAAAVSDTDAIAVDQGGAALVRQNFSALWSYVATKLPTARKRVIELTAATVLDASTHNDAILVCSQPLTLFANYGNMGSGFSCDVLNLSSGNVTMGSGITVGNGLPILPAQATAHVQAVTFSGGEIVFWAGLATSAGSGGGTSPTPAVTISVATTSMTGTALTLSGTVSPSGDAVGVALASSATVTPTALTAATVSGGGWSASLTPSTAGTFYAWAIDSAAGTHAVSSAITVSALSGGTTVTWGASEPIGPYATNQGSIGANAVMHPGTAAAGVNFGWSTSTTVAPGSWTAGAEISTQSNGDTVWAAFLTAPATAGTYYGWAQTSDAAAHVVSGAVTVS